MNQLEQPGAAARLYAGACLNFGTQTLDVIFSTNPKPGWLEPVSFCAVDLLRRFISAGSGGVDFKTMSRAERSSLNVDLQLCLGLRFRRTGSIVCLIQTVAIVDQRAHASEAA